jgi:hypothetical protein
MTISDQLESALLQLSPAEREQLALFAWESLENAQEWLSDPRTDAEGVTIANERDSDIESNAVLPLDRIELRCRTLDPAE